jgi:hypothetical protein
MAVSSPIPHNWEVPQVFRDRFGARAGRQRVMTADGHMLIILHDIPRPNAEPMARLYWRKPDGSWRSSASSATTINALRAHVEELSTTIDLLETRAATATRAKDWFSIMHEAAPLHRTVLGQSTTLQEARDLVKGDRDLISIRDVAQENERAVELITTHARAGLDYTIAQNAEASAHATEHVVQSQHRLNLIAATFLPIGALGALLGTNLKSGLETWNAPYAFWIVMAFALVLGIIVRATLPAAKSE